MPGHKSDGASGGHEILIEFVVQGNAVKVTAIDSVSGIEATIVAPASAPRSVLEDSVSRKLAYVIRKQKGAD
jgi:hypothetical protein